MICPNINSENERSVELTIPEMWKKEWYIQCRIFKDCCCPWLCPTELLYLTNFASRLRRFIQHLDDAVKLLPVRLDFIVFESWCLVIYPVACLTFSTTPSHTYTRPTTYTPIQPRSRCSSLGGVVLYQQPAHSRWDRWYAYPLRSNSLVTLYMRQRERVPIPLRTVKRLALKVPFHFSRLTVVSSLNHPPCQDGLSLGTVKSYCSCRLACSRHTCLCSSRL